MPLTITEALAEIKTIGNRTAKKREGIIPFLARQDGVRDPLEKSGGTVAYIAQERQGLGDLGARVVALRRGIQRANDTTPITINGTSRTISEWLTWRREIAPGEKAFLNQLRAQINAVRDNAKRQGVGVAQPGTAQQPADFIINLPEQELAAQIEGLEETLGALDGQLSLKNATVIIQED
jgi:hypothetical protein